MFFARADASYVGAGSVTSGDGFGPVSAAKSQSRLMLEAGILF
jgi:hypothetical protein